MQLRPLLLTSLAALSLALACKAGPAGIHVVVTMKDADFDADHTFDHLTVTATIGERRADACLFPADAVDREVPLDEPSPTGCADLRTQPWNGPPTAQTWALEATPRTVNVEAKAGEEVVVTVTGGLGGRLGTVRGEGKARASTLYPELRIELAPDQKVFPDGCDARLEPSFPDSFDAKYALCQAAESSCPGLAPGLSRSPAIFCTDEGASRVRNAPGLTCDVQTGVASVWHTPGSITLKTCLRMFVRGHFVRCMKGDPTDPHGCAETTDCAPPATALWTRDVNDLKTVFSSASMECIPPAIVPITWSVDVPLPDKAVVYGLDQDVQAASDGSCFLDVEAISGTFTDCPP